MLEILTYYDFVCTHYAFFHNDYAFLQTIILNFADYNAVKKSSNKTLLPESIC